MQFNLGWWGFIFPLGIYSLATLALARATHLTFLSVVGSILVFCLAALWFMVAVLTVDGVWHGYLFVGPRLRRWPVTNRFESNGGSKTGIGHS
jgi:tellurite resistance protein TehA-like permease